MIIEGFKQDIQHRLNKIWEDCMLQTSIWTLHKLYTIEWLSNVTHDMSALVYFTRDYYIHTMSDTHGMIRLTLNERKTEHTSKTLMLSVHVRCIIKVIFLMILIRHYVFDIPISNMNAWHMYHEHTVEKYKLCDAYLEKNHQIVVWDE